jgi:apolipoprotein D and lipocalin family protein
VPGLTRRRRQLAPALGLALALAACAGPERPATGFRDPAQPIYSNAVTDPARLAGDWVQIATFAAADAPACAPGRLRISQTPGGLELAARLCVAGQPLRAVGPLAVTGPGRVTPERAEGALAGEWWLLWLDSGARSAVLGTPSGGFGLVLNRDGAIPADRLQAAREVLDFNGYDLSRLVLLGDQATR